MGFRILIVDDSPLIRKCIRASIQEMPNWKVCGEAENGQIGIEKTKDLNPDLVILDLSMPVMNGLDAARHINQAFPNLPLVMLTMHASEQLSEEAKAAGIKEVLPKDKGLDDLLRSMRVLLASPSASGFNY
jgi:two-component system, NarL family, nitrate/nitrite response regulator NarL